MEWESSLETLYGHEKDLEAGEAFETYIDDRETYERKRVRAVITREGKMSGSEKLWVWNFQGQVRPEPWSIKIIEEISPSWKG